MTSLLVCWKPVLTSLGLAALLVFCQAGVAEEKSDTRVLVELPDPLKQHMLANMRGHLAAINQILNHLGNQEMDAASDIAEYRLGMSSLDEHGADHMARFMPRPMRELGTQMHRAASRLALTAQEGDVLPAYRALTEVTAACVACHAGFRIH